MTGKDLIIYILQNNLENEDLFSDGRFLGLLNAEETAARFNVGTATVMLWYVTGMLDGMNIAGSIFFRKDVADPRTVQQ